MDEWEKFAAEPVVAPAPVSAAEMKPPIPSISETLDYDLAKLNTFSDDDIARHLLEAAELKEACATIQKALETEVKTRLVVGTPFKDQSMTTENYIIEVSHRTVRGRWDSEALKRLLTDPSYATELLEACTVSLSEKNYSKLKADLKSDLAGHKKPDREKAVVSVRKNPKK